MTTTHLPVRRVFFALLPDTSIRKALSREVDDIVAAGQRGLRWLQADDWHITLRFIGDVRVDRIEGINACTRQVASRHGPVSLLLEQVEPFPSIKHPRVLAAMGPATPAASALVADLESACRALGLPAESREWRCHLTLARMRGRSASTMRSRPVDLVVNARHLVLMESVVVEQQRRYPVMESAQLSRSEENPTVPPAQQNPS